MCTDVEDSSCVLPVLQGLQGAVRPVRQGQRSSICRFESAHWQSQIRNMHGAFHLRERCVQVPHGLEAAQDDGGGLQGAQQLRRDGALRMIATGLSFLRL